MNEWIDFAVYSVQAIIMWIAVPRHAARFTRPMLFDRNPEWAAANPELVDRLARGGWWRQALHTWAIITVLVLLMFRLGLQPDWFTPGYMRTPGWEVLMTTNNLLMTLGTVLFGLGMWRNIRWLKRNVPLAETRQASLTPRRTDDFVPRGFQYLVYAFMGLNVVARPMADLLYPGRLENVWGASILIAIVSVLIFLVAAVGVARPPNAFDRAIGPSYRRLEVQVYFGIMIGLVLIGLLSVYLELNGVDMRRYGAVIIAACATVGLVGFLWLPWSRERGSPGGHGQAELPVAGPTFR